MHGAENTRVSRWRESLRVCPAYGEGGLETDLTNPWKKKSIVSFFLLATRSMEINESVLRGLHAYYGKYEPRNQGCVDEEIIVRRERNRFPIFGSSGPRWSTIGRGLHMVYIFFHQFHETRPKPILFIRMLKQLL